MTNPMPSGGKANPRATPKAKPRKKGIDAVEKSSEGCLVDETEYLLSDPANSAHLRRGLDGDPDNRVVYKNVAELRKRLGI